MTNLTAVFSTLFRLCVYFYLRLIPVHRIARFVLPSFFVAYLISYLTDAKPPPTITLVKEKEVIEIKDEKTGEVVAEVAAEAVSVSVEPANGHVKPARPISSGNAFVDTIGSVLFTFPSKSKLLNNLGLLLNTAFFLFALDFAYTPALKTYDPTFTRVGAVDHASAKVLVRYPSLEEGQLRVVYQRVRSVPSHTDIWKEGPVLDIEEEKDWTASGKITGLWPSAEYVYRLAYLNSTFLPYPETPITFKTFPDPRSSAGTHFKFIVSSCMTPNFPYNPAFPERIKGLDILSDWIDSFKPKPVEVTSTPASPASPLEEAESVVSDASSILTSAVQSPSAVLESLSDSPKKELTPEFMILAGDAIYADVPYYDGDHPETYRKKYRRTFASSSYRKVYEKLPIFSIYDDHEIINNFAGEGDELKAPFYNASSAFNTYYGSVNPEPHSSDVNYYDFRYGDNAFFVLDTRRYRSPPDADPEQALPTMLGEKQLYALHSWLGKVNSTATYKFIVSSVPFTSLWHGFDGQKDSWAAYRIERDSLLDVLQYVPNVVILSGDRHEFAFVEHRGKIPEISVSPLSMFALNSMTLHDRSPAFIEKTYIDTSIDAEGASIEVIAVEQIPEERAVHYIPAGNYKFVSFEVDTRDWRRPTLILEAIIAGKSTYKFQMVGQPVALSYTSSLAVSFGGALKGVLNKFGLFSSAF